jgi:hypothetical protein
MRRATPCWTRLTRGEQERRQARAQVGLERDLERHAVADAQPSMSR